MDLEILKSTNLDPKFKDEISNLYGQYNLKRCYQCGTCSASCPVSEIEEKYNPRRILRMVMLGMRDRVLSSDFIWLCSQCYACGERCPQDVHIPEIMESIKNIAIKEGYVHNSLTEQTRTIGESGSLYPLSEFEKRRRRLLGLPELSPNNSEVKEIFKITGLNKLVFQEDD